MSPEQVSGLSAPDAQGDRTAHRPRFADLPIAFDGTDYRHAWDWFPTGDNLGCLNLITENARLRALSTVTEGSTVNLTLPLDLPDPPMFGRAAYEHTIFQPSRNNLDDRLDSFYPQASTQWDGFRHVRARENGFFTGHQGEFSPDDDRLGINHFAEVGIVGRGVLLDFSEVYQERVPSGAADDGDCFFGPSDVLEALERAETEPRQGDIVCIRSGWMRRYLAAGPDERARQAHVRRWPGLAGTAAMAELLWDWGVAAVVADNPAVEWGPGSVDQGNLHRRVVPLLGVVFGELFTFEALVDGCRRLGRAEFLFASVPLNLPGGVGSPGNAIAVL